MDIRYPWTKYGQTYGQHHDWSEDAKKYKKQGKLLIEHAVYPETHLLPEGQVIKEFEFDYKNMAKLDEDTGLFLGGNEYDRYVQVVQLLHDIRAQRLGREKLKPGHQFATHVGDGAAHYVVTKVSRVNCTVEWRGFNPDRYVDRIFGWGGSFRRKDVEPLVGIGRKSLSSIFEKEDRTEKLENAAVQWVNNFKHEFGHLPLDIAFLADDLAIAVAA